MASLRTKHCLAAALLVFLPSSLFAATITFTNAAPIAIPGLGNGVPYPSTINVAGMGSILDLTVTLNDFSHTFPDDVGVMLVGPTGVGIIVFDGGTNVPAANLNLTFADGGALWPNSGPLSSTTYEPRSYYSLDVFAPPAPVIPGVNPTTVGPKSFSVFDGTDPNGVWSLWVKDFTALDSGTIAGGWSLTITDASAAAVPEPGTLSMIGIGAIAAIGRWASSRKRRSGRIQGR